MDGVEGSIGPSGVDQVLLAELAKSEIDDAIGMDSALHVAVDVFACALLRGLGQLVAMRAGSADDPSRDNACGVLLPIRGVVDVRRVVVGMAGDEVDMFPAACAS